MNEFIPKPPYSKAAELQVLGAMMRDPANVGLVTAQLADAADFYPAAHQVIYEALCGLYDRGQPCDAAAVAEQLKAQDKLADIGSITYLAEILEECPTGSNVEYYLGIVRDLSLQRRLIRAAVEILTCAERREGSGPEQLEAAEKAIYSLAMIGHQSAAVPIAQAVTEAYLRLDVRMNADRSQLIGVPTGLTELDALTGGMQEGELVLLAARPSIGKTAMCLAWIRHACVTLGLPTFFASLEQARVEIADRLLCSLASVPSHRLRNGQLSPQDLQRLQAAGDVIRRAPLFIDDEAGQSAMRIAATARRLKMQHGIRLVVVDYVQIVAPENRKDNRAEQVAQVSRRMKRLARELKIPVVCLAQLNRGADSRTKNERPRLSDLKDSGSLEQDADTVFMLHVPDEQQPSQIEVLVAKQRNGPRGEVLVHYEGIFIRFEDLKLEPPDLTPDDEL